MPTEAELKNAFANVGEVLHLKDNQVASSQTSMFESVPVSYFSKIYNFSQPQVRQKALQSNKYHFNELEYMDKPYYILKTSEIFPYDQEQLDSKTVKKQIQNTLRPEFFTNYQQYLLADTMKEY